MNSIIFLFTVGLFFFVFFYIWLSSNRQLRFSVFKLRNKTQFVNGSEILLKYFARPGIDADV